MPSRASRRRTSLLAAEGGEIVWLNWNLVLLVIRNIEEIANTTLCILL